VIHLQMPPSRSLKKSKAKIKKDVHPKSRKFKIFNRAMERESRLQRQQPSSRRQALRKRIDFTKQHIGEDVTGLTDQHMHAIIEIYIAREEEAWQKLEDSRRGRSKTSQQDSIETRKAHELAEWTSGFLAPDISDERTVRELLGGCHIENMRMKEYKRLS